MSSSAAVVAVDITKRFRSARRERTALRSFDAEIPSGKVTALLGPNGAGKTTFLRLCSGQLRSSSGTLSVLGMRIPDELPKVIDRVGVLIESAGMYPAFSVRRNLEILAVGRGIDSARVDAVLDAVGLEQRAGDRAKSLSLGMRQRLGVAAALLKDPELLLLDEPLNGLDPRAVTEMRSLMRSLAESGRTVVVSSHLLDEVQLVCDEVIFIDAGRMVGSGSLSELLGGDGPRPITVTVSAADADRAQRVISASDWEFVRCAGRNLTVAPTSQPLWQFVRLLEESGCCVESVRSGRTVEDLYLDNVLAMDGTERIHDAE